MAMKNFEIDGLPNFLRYGALLACRSSAISPFITVILFLVLRMMVSLIILKAELAVAELPAAGQTKKIYIFITILGKKVFLSIKSLVQSL